MTVPSLTLLMSNMVGDGHPCRVVVGQAYYGLTGGYLLLRIFSESSCLLYLRFKFDFYVSKIMHL